MGFNYSMVKKFDLRIFCTVQNKYVHGNEIFKPMESDGSRLVYRSKNYILKVETDDDSDHRRIYQCRRENELWKIIEKQDRKFFASILLYETFGTHDIVINHRVRLKHPKYATKEVLSKCEDILIRMKEKYSVFEVDTDPDYPTNWAVVENNPFIYDYGV